MVIIILTLGWTKNLLRLTCLQTFRIRETIPLFWSTTIPIGLLPTYTSKSKYKNKSTLGWAITTTAGMLI